MGMVLEVVLLYIPGFVEKAEMMKFESFLASINKDVPVMILAFFPEYMLLGFRKLTYSEVLKAYKIMKEHGLKNVKIGNVSVFCSTRQCLDKLIKEVVEKQCHYDIMIAI